MRKFSIGKLIMILIVAALVGFILYSFLKPRPTGITIEQLKEYIANGGSVDSKSYGAPIGSLFVFYVYITGGKNPGYYYFSGGEDVVENNEIFGGKINLKVPTDWFSTIISLLPLLLFLGLMIWMFVGMKRGAGQGAGGGLFGMGGGEQSYSKPTTTNVRFSDVAGIEEEKNELIEVVDYLKHPSRYTQMGARVPKGVLLCGEPGCGKTLLAKAVAGEAKVPFYSASGSDFEEMFVGLGASRIRTMFKNAKKNSPCIIFIDEIDTVGRSRGMGGMQGTHEQTLNQLLSEMDGFQTNSGVVIMGATNRLEILDPAITRPGRFDRTVMVARPDINERIAILKVHSRNKNISSAVDFEEIARRTPGFTGAMLENVLNEAAILAVRNNKRTISLSEIDEGIDRTVAGPAKKSRAMTSHEKELIAFHEAGHALIGLHLKKAMKVEKVTIIPRGKAGGYTVMQDEQEKHLMSKNDLESMIVGLMGGRSAEEFKYGGQEITTGASDDLMRATNIARTMVTELGMSELGLTQFESQQAQAANPYAQRRYSDVMAQKIDNVISKILDWGHKEAQKIIAKNSLELEIIAKSLILLETITSPQINHIHKTLQYPKEALEAKAKLSRDAENDGTDKKRSASKRTKKEDAIKETSKPHSASEKAAKTSDLNVKKTDSNSDSKQSSTKKN